MSLFRRIAWWWNRRAHQAELAEEMAAHEAMKQRDLEAGGLPPEAAARVRRREMGNVTFMREQARSVWIWPWLERLGQDVRYALRSARRAPAFSVGVIAITALGLGATTTIFSVVDGVMIRPLPYPAADRLIYFDDGHHSPPRFRDWQRSIQSIETWTAVWSGQEDLVGDGRPERLGVSRISPDYFTVFAGRIGIGRSFTAGDYEGAGQVGILSAELWRRRFGGDEGVLGRVLDLGGKRVVVVGVLAEGFVEPQDYVRARTDVWLPLVYTPDVANNPNYSILSVVGRLKPGVTLAMARQELAALAPRLDQENHEVHGAGEIMVDGSSRNRPFPIPVAPFQQVIVGDFDRALGTLFAAVGLMLAIACANVTNLYLARGTDRHRELSIRAALGAGRGRLTRQLVTESVTLGTVSGLLGIGLAVAGVRVLARLYPGNLPRAGEVAVDGRVLAFALGMAVLTGVVFGLVPAWTLRERHAHDGIKGTGAGAARTRSRLRSALVVAEVALALTLLVGSALLFHSFLRIIRVDPGFDPTGLVMARLQLGEPFTADKRQVFARGLMERVRGIPGVTAVTYGVAGPMATTGQGRCCWGHREAKADDGRVVQGRIMLHPVGPRYFETLGARVAGATFGAEDALPPPVAQAPDRPPQSSGVHPVVISEELATKLFGPGPAVGRRFSVGENQYGVRGVVTGLRQWGLDQGEGLEIFMPYETFGGDFDRLLVTVRGSADAAALVPLLRQAIWDVDRTVPADDIATMETLIRDSLAGPRFYGTLMGAFAGLALLLAAAGIYASMLYSVRQRTREMGIRIALGAATTDISRMVVGDATRLAAVGLLLGGLGAFALARSLGALLFGIGPTDPVAFTVAATVLALTVVFSAWIPARRAGRADPVTVLRAD